MKNIDRYQALLKKREQVDAKTKTLEKKIFSLDGHASEAELQEWHKLELKRRAIALETARQWQTLTTEERKEEASKYDK